MVYAGSPISKNRNTKLAHADGSALRVLLATAVEDGVIRTNPAAGVRLPAMRTDATFNDGPATKALTETELAALLAACPPQWELLVRFLADTGLRLGEASALRWCDIDLGRRRVLVRRQWTAGAYAAPKAGTDAGTCR